MTERTIGNIGYFCVVIGCLIVGFSIGTNFSMKGMNMPEEPKKTACPNCIGVAIKEGNKIICENCDATFTFTKTGGAKLREIGRLDSLEQRMDRVETLLPGQEPDPAKLEPDPADLEPDPADQESSLLGPG